MAALAAKDIVKRLAKRRILILLVLAVLACFGGIISIMKGSVNVPLNEIIAAMTGGSAGMHQQIILNIRLPRTIVAGLVGVNLALSGAILQAVMKNPLADPHIIGISAGAGIMGIFIMLLFPDLSWLITPAAFAGAMGAAILIIILAGVAVSAFLGAGISALMIIYSDRVHSALMWMVGGLSARSWPQVMIIWPYTLAGMIFTLLAARHLNILQLGDELAKGLGLRVERTRLILTAAAALLAASAVSVVGLLGFVGLIVPHAARLMIGSDYRYLLPATIFLGAATVMLSDTFARVAFAPVELPVGIIMAAIGAPFFLFLLRREL